MTPPAAISPPSIAHASRVRIASVTATFNISARAAALALDIDASGCSVHEPARLVLVAESAGDERVDLCARLVLASAQRNLLHVCDATCNFVRHVGMLHLSLEGSAGTPRYLCLVMDEAGRTLFARSDVPSMIGLRGGTYDPPLVDVVRAESD